MPPQTSTLSVPSSLRPPFPALRRERRWPGSAKYRVPLLAIAAFLPLYWGWDAVLATDGGDLAAQYAWAGFVGRHPATPYGLFWFGGVHTVNYSVISPHLMALCGVRAVSVLSGISATWVLATLLERTLPRVSTWPALVGALGLWYNVVLGRTTFALGLAFALAGLLAVADRAPRPARLAAAALGALFATMGSPVAGLFLLVAGAGYLVDRQYGKCLALSLPPVAVVGVTTVLFPFQGEQPMAAGRMILPLLLSAAVVWASPREWRVVRASSVVYAVGVVLTWVVPSPVGNNVERLALLFAPAVLLAAALHRRSGAFRHGGRRTRMRAMALVTALSVSYLCASSLTHLRRPDPVPGWVTHTDGVIAALDRLGADRGRVELPTDDDHRGATLLGPHFELMRGWNQQLDVERGRLFYEGHLDGPRYYAWLRHWAVGFVVLHDGKPDRSAERETALIQEGQRWLEPVWQDQYWKIYRVRDTLPLVSAPAELLRAGEADLTLSMPGPGTSTVRIAYSPWLRAEGACVSADGPWTRLTVPRAGVYRLTSDYAAESVDESGCPPAG
ncbi:hypothetical protein [Streptomyces sp. NBC_00199]|uniref:hypothetical protein n=1 Tax=Streptomyces sp. NBC_00199 TaxID=2975678 RepID=UPI0022567252|nr:hypothetical protein [Streptomyces sp. NBC_00199]MCX5264275.1 hypothetical protein [Streptomyces sp. NBC_00199]